ncbi:MAG: L-serine ammonia-lyase, iron-sulfur-dependent, subunit alpha [Planctomycetia bacterium]|nr:L-serine ammonia-lyase, iron-sulfur-dependent, subunit alpha [Planctomycetia bacterium]
MSRPELKAYFQEILQKELVPATGCTEPIAIAYAAALARDLLGGLPEKTVVQVSGNLIKNVKSVYVPNTDYQKGIAAAAAVGFIAGEASRELEVIARVSQKQRQEVKEYLARNTISVEYLDSDCSFDLIITVRSGNHEAKVHMVDYHTNIVEMTKDGAPQEIPHRTAKTSTLPVIGPAADHKQILDEHGTEYDFSRISVQDILDFSHQTPLNDLRAILKQQIEYNMAIVEAGLKNPFGANIGSTILKSYGSQDVKIRAQAYTAAGSDARMGGCPLPVVINSGSGNQGLTVSVPVIVYARELKASDEKLYRALILSNLLAIYIKNGMGRLSAYCGVVSAASGAGAGIAYLHGGMLREIAHTVVNSIAILSGVVCDGAKSSCAAKIAAAVHAAILGFLMFENEENEFVCGEGLVAKGIEATLNNIIRLGKDGMRETDKEIIRIMME